MFRNCYGFLVPLTFLLLWKQEHPCISVASTANREFGTDQFLQIIRKHVQSSKLSSSEVWNLLAQVRHAVEQAAADPSARHTAATPKLLRAVASNHLESLQLLTAWASAITSQLKERTRSRRTSSSLESISSLLRHGIAATLVRTVLTRDGSAFASTSEDSEMRECTQALMTMLVEVRLLQPVS